MTTTLIILAVIIGVALIAALWVMGTYNGLVKLRNRYRNAFSQIDVQLKRRHELIPRLVATVKAYSDYEKATLSAGTELRQQSRATPELPQKAVLETAIQAGLQKLVVVAEEYPELKADANFRQLQQELADTEDQIQYARRFYNGSVRQYNTRIQSFPHLVLAGPMGFNAADYFALESDIERKNPAVDVS